jgi:hypothetical protein
VYEPILNQSKYKKKLSTGQKIDKKLESIAEKEFDEK